MSLIEQLVLGELAKQDELKAFGERGFHLQSGDDETRLWFQPTTAVADDFGLCATAFIETILNGGGFGPGGRCAASIRSFLISLILRSRK